MDRHKMLMGDKSEPKKAKAPSKRNIITNTRTVPFSEIGIDGHDLEAVIRMLRNLEEAEKARGHFTVRLDVETEGDYEDSYSVLQISTERYETDEEVAEREAAEAKREEKKRKKAEKMKTVEYQQSLIKQMNRNVAKTMRY